MIVIQNNKTLKTAYTEKIDSVDYVTITNSGTETVDAYMYIDYDNTLETSGLSLSTTYSGTYIGLEDSIFIGPLGQADYKISKAYFDNTNIDYSGRVSLTNVSLGTGT